MPLSRIAWALCCAGWLWPLAPRLAAQGAPYSKTELIRLLGAPGVNRQLVAAQVGVRCVGFVPTARDLLDLRAAGADSAILHHVATCGHSGGPLLLVLPPPGRAPAGSEATLEVRLVRGTVPQPDVRLVLRGASTLPGGSRTEPTAVTDPSGVARFRVATGTQAGTYQIEVATARAAGGARATWALTVTGGLATRADVSPPELVVMQGDRALIPVRVELRDVPGNRVADAPVELVRASGEPIPGVAAGSSDSAGVLTFEVPATALTPEAPLIIVSGGRSLAAVAVRIRSRMLSPDQTRFLSGTNQQGVVGAELSELLVFEVRDALGGPVPGYAVRLTGTNATVPALTQVTDDQGRVMLRVTLGARAGPAIVTARAGELTREARFYAFPGEPRQLVVQHPGGEPVAGTLAVTTRDPVALRVVARDALGNGVPTGDVQAAVTGSAVRMGRARQGALPGTIVLEPRRPGPALVTVRAVGLEQQVPVEVARLGSGWLWGARLGGAALSYDFSGAPGVGGRGGGRAELHGGRRVAEGLRLQLVLGAGLLGATTGTGDVTALLWQGAARIEYELVRDTRVVPVIALGGGGYRVKSTDPGTSLHHTSLFWTGGAGVDVRLSPSAVGELRLSAQRLVEVSGGGPSGGVAWLTLLEVGVRFAP